MSHTVNNPEYKVQHEFAIDQNGKTVHIDDVINRNKKYYCIDENCKCRMTPRLGSIKQHHFSHWPGSNPNCSDESIIHYNTKYKILDYLNEKIAINGSLIVERQCELAKKDCNYYKTIPYPIDVFGYYLKYDFLTSPYIN